MTQQPDRTAIRLDALPLLAGPDARCSRRVSAVTLSPSSEDAQRLPVAARFVVSSLWLGEAARPKSKVSHMTLAGSPNEVSYNPAYGLTAAPASPPPYTTWRILSD